MAQQGQVFPEPFDVHTVDAAWNTKYVSRHANGDNGEGR